MFKKASNRITGETSCDLLGVVASVSFGHVPTDTGAAAFAPWDDPDPTAVHVQPSFTRVWLFPLLRLPHASTT